MEVNDPRSGAHAFFTIDADTDLPVSLEMRGVDVDGSVLGRMNFQFNGEVDDSWLEPVLPTGVKFEYINPMDRAGGGDFWDGIGEMFDDDEIVRTEKKVSVRH